MKTNTVPSAQVSQTTRAYNDWVHMRSKKDDPQLRALKTIGAMLNQPSRIIGENGSLEDIGHAAQRLLAACDDDVTTTAAKAWFSAVGIA